MCNKPETKFIYHIQFKSPSFADWVIWSWDSKSSSLTCIKDMVKNCREKFPEYRFRIAVTTIKTTTSNSILNENKQ